MSSESLHTSSKNFAVHWSYWVIAVLALLWHLPAIANVLMQITTETVTESDDPVQVILSQRPGWATLGFALFAVAGTLGACLLLMRKSVAVWLFSLSLIGVVVHFVGLLRIDNVPAQMTMGCVMSLIGAVFFIWYSRYATRRRWKH